MFARRHPFLFFLLVMSALGAVVVVSITALVFIGRCGGNAAFGFGEQVGVIEIEGIIADPKPVLAQLKEFRNNEDVKAIVLRIDSPGGGVGPSQEIYGEVRKTILVKSVVASMGAISASGGYYIASATDHIVANPGTITGSIGVLMEFANFEELFGKIGISAFVLKSGEYKDVGSPLREMTPEEETLLQRFVDDVHRQFVSDVAEGRNMAEEEIQAVADGRILSGEEAQGLGLLDTLGNLEDAIAVAAELGGIEGEPSVLYTEKEFSLMNYLLGPSGLRGALDSVTSAALRSGYLCFPWNP